MKSKTEIPDILKRLATLAALSQDNATAMPPEMYHSSKVAKREQRDIFKQEWLCAGLSNAIPLLAGPGTISATILLSSQMSASTPEAPWLGVGVLMGIIIALMALTAVTLMAAEVLDKYIGNTGKMILTRLLGVLLAALSVQYVADGASALFAPAIKAVGS